MYEALSNQPATGDGFYTSDDVTQASFESSLRDASYQIGTTTDIPMWGNVDESQFRADKTFDQEFEDTIAYMEKFEDVTTKSFWESLTQGFAPDPKVIAADGDIFEFEPGVFKTSNFEAVRAAAAAQGTGIFIEPSALNQDISVLEKAGNVAAKIGISQLNEPLSTMFKDIQLFDQPEFYIDMENSRIGMDMRSYSADALAAKFGTAALNAGIDMATGPYAAIVGDIETGVVQDITNRDNVTYNYTGWTGPAASVVEWFGGTTSSMTTPEEQAAKSVTSDVTSAAIGGSDSGGSVTSNVTNTATGGTTITDAITSAGIPSYLSPGVMGQTTGTVSLVPKAAQPYVNPYAKLFAERQGVARAACGGKIEKMAEGGEAGRTVDIGFLVNNQEDIKRNPEKYMINPSVAADDTERNYVVEYNKFLVELQEGKATLPQMAMAGGGPVGFVGEQPEQVQDGQTVADDVQMEVPEGSYVLNAAAVEFAGSEDVKTMLLDAMKEAEQQGVDISNNGNKIDKNTAVSLLVSKGEVVIPPTLAKIIGYDRLEKINARGAKETEKRLQENGEQPQQEQQLPAEGMAMAKGGEARRPTHEQLYIDFMLGKEDDITEADFTDEELQYIGQIIKKQREKNDKYEGELLDLFGTNFPFRKNEQGQNVDSEDNNFWYYDDPSLTTVEDEMGKLADKIRSFEDSRGRTSITTYDENINEPVGHGDYDEQIKDVDYRVRASLGKFTAHDNEDGSVTIKDSYNFNQSEYEPSVWNFLSNFRNIMGSKQNMAEVAARHVRPDHSRNAIINIPAEYLK
jgi:hypothetical protein